jgi:hypothetical protein
VRILCTHPGRYGDILWALPTMRAISQAYGQPVDLIIPGEYRGIADLVEAQPYVRMCAARDDWRVEQTAPITPRVPPRIDVSYDQIYHLGYEGWPTPTLAEDVYDRAAAQYGQAQALAPYQFPELDLETPWVTTSTIVRKSDRPRVWLGWSEEYFELKVGLTVALATHFPDVEFWWIRPWGGRYDEVDRLADFGQHRLGKNVGMIRAHWHTTVDVALSCHVFLGCLSASWVLANALGLPTVIVEPNAQRHQPVFWRESPKNHLVLGGDGLPTFDARHAGDVLEQVLKEI